jgi:hypothetical protein
MDVVKRKARFKILKDNTAVEPASSMGTRVLYLRVKRPGREAHHSPSSSVEVNNGWS